MIVKAGDTHEVKWRANMDLADASVRLIARPRRGTPVILSAEVTDAESGEVTHSLTGELAEGTYRVELEVTIGGQIATFPNNDYAHLVVMPDLG